MDKKKWKEHLPYERAIAGKIRSHTESFIFTLISCNGGFESEYRFVLNVTKVVASGSVVFMLKIKKVLLKRIFYEFIRS